MYTQTLIALAVVIGMAVTIVILGRSPKQRRRVVQPPREPGTSARPNVTQYSERSMPSQPR